MLWTRIGIDPKGELDVVLLGVARFFKLFGFGIRSTELVYRFLQCIPPVNLDAPCLPGAVFMPRIQHSFIESNGNFRPVVGPALVIFNELILTSNQAWHRAIWSSLVKFLERVLATVGSASLAVAVKSISEASDNRRTRELLASNSPETLLGNLRKRGLQ